MNREKAFGKRRRGIPISTTIAATGAAISSAYLFLIRPWLLGWGATQAEAQRPLPGDDLIAHPKIEATQAITIHAPTAEVWPWLVQWGYQRAGFYSYDFIDRALGSADVTSSDRILPEHQQLNVGDRVLVAPDNGFVVKSIDPGKHIVLEARYDTTTGKAVENGQPLPEAFLVTSWTWYLEPVGPQSTRMISRMKINYSSTLSNELMYHLFIEPGSCIMDRKMLLGIRDRAETAWQAKSGTVPGATPA